MIENMADLQALVRAGEQNWDQYGDVYTVRHEGMLLFNYGSAAQYANRWNWFERVSRGLILDEKTGEVLARPFDKFWNWGDPRHSTGAELVEVTEKMDGSLGILYRRDGEYRIATRGSFVSDQAVWATAWLNRHYASQLDTVPDAWTLLFEIIYPANRIVVDYEGYEALVLVGVRDRRNGHDYVSRQWPLSWPWPRAMRANIGDLHSVLASTKALDGTKQEGWVCRFADGQRFKVKGEHYVFLHRLVTQASFKRVVRAMVDGTLDAMIAGVPDELIEPVLAWRDEIENRVAGVTVQVEKAFMLAPMTTRKEYALWVKAERPELMPYMFARLDGRDYRPMIIKNEFKEGANGHP